MPENEIQTVATPAGAGADPVAVVTPKEVTSTEVKPTATQQFEAGDIAKMQEQINNLNTALKQERELGKTASAELKEELARSKETIDKLKSVFSPEQPKVEQPESLTMAQIEALLEQRDQRKQEETHKETQTRLIKEEIATLEKEWDGSDGKPKYEDRKVLDWQEKNNKLHLSPKEAFNIMYKDSIIDWEIKNRTNKKPVIKPAEVPGGSPTLREPNGAPVMDTQGLRSAVLEAMEIASNSNN